MSRHSEPRTVLLWGHRWWIAGQAEPREFADLSAAAQVLADCFAEAPKPARIRLVYQPDGFISARVACPHANRATLAAALAGEYPGLSDPATAWGHEPILAEGEGHSTVLYLEAESALLNLARELATHGIAVDSAWPLAAFLHAVPEEWTESGAFTVVALQSGSAVAYHHPKDGGREARTWEGGDALSEAARWLSGLAREEPDQPVLVVPADDRTTAEIGAQLSAGAHPNLTVYPLAEVLRRHVVLPRYHPAQLLPREPVISAQRLALAASLAFFLWAGGTGLSVGLEWLEARAEAPEQLKELGLLREEVARLRANASEIARLRREFADGTPKVRHAEVLGELAAQLPPSMAFDTVKIAGNSLAIAGWVAPPAGASVVEAWRRTLTAGSRVSGRVQSGADGSFSLTGEIHP